MDYSLSPLPPLPPQQHLSELRLLFVIQVSKWFENSRWSFRHSSHMNSKMIGSASVNGTSSPQISEKVPEIGEQSSFESSPCTEEEKMALPQISPCVKRWCNAGTGEGKSVIDSIHDSMQRKSTKVDDQELDQLSSAKETSKQDSHVDASKSQSVRRSSRLQARSSR